MSNSKETRQVHLFRQVSRPYAPAGGPDDPLQPGTSLHGYAIEKQLQGFKFFQNQPPDYTGLYRLLKKMDAEGLLASQESDSESGPSKRVYCLTDRGRNCLSKWLDSLLEYQQMLDDLLVQAKRTVEVNT